MSSLPEYKVTVHRGVCIACRQAPSICPIVFESDQYGKTIVKEEFRIRQNSRISEGIIGDDLLKCVEEAAKKCPVSAIKIEKLEHG